MIHEYDDSDFTESLFVTECRHRAPDGFNFSCNITSDLQGPPAQTIEERAQAARDHYGDDCVLMPILGCNGWYSLYVRDITTKQRQVF